MKHVFSILLLFNGCIVFAQNQVNLVPVPAEVTLSPGSYSFGKEVKISCNFPKQENEPFIIYLKKELEKRYGAVVYFTGANNAADIAFKNQRMPTSGKPAYQLDINKLGVTVTSNFDEPAFNAIQTLFQLIRIDTNKQMQIPFAKIFDHARFDYRGMHLDVARHFFPVSFIKKYIDYLAAYKFNTFHWHLTDDQGWRIEIKKYPELTKTGAWRNGSIVGRYPGKGNDNKPYGGFYTEAEIKEVVQYAKERYINVIPEIEMPGHSSAAIAAYRWLSCFPEKPTEIPANMISHNSIDEQKNGRIKLVQETWGVFDDVFCAGKDSTFKFLEDVIDEVTELFPSKYFHLGADECPKTHWKICPACQKRMRDNNLKDEHELQSWFVQRIEKYMNSKGKTMIGWDEILEGGLAPKAVVMSWRGEAGGIEAAKQKHAVIMTPGNPVYFDHSQSKNEDSVTIGGYNPIEAVYDYEPIPKELNADEGKYILGAQANMWSEYLAYPSKVEYMLFPRIVALSEVLWSPKEKRDWKDFERRLPGVFERLDKEKINYSKAYYDLVATVLPTENYQGILFDLKSKNPNETIFVHGGGNVFPYTSPLVINKSQTINATLGDNKSQLWQKFVFNKATGKKINIITEPSKSYPGNGAFTLVDGIQNEKGLAKSSEFLGFSGTNLDATIDLGKNMDVSNITLHVLKMEGSWIYLPGQVEVTYIPYHDPAGISPDIPVEMVTININPNEDLNKIEIKKEKLCRYIHLVAKNYGSIPAGKPGAGNPAWLFVDEIEVH
ncbi:MAG: beta-N-acetylhexosaminidase [Ferruginibacter sp.]